ncbi:MAG: acyltransferase family protein [Proteobacteria bacterium]|nr:acyltransferase family protein [Pseudomonadota bacterium]
MPIDVTTQLQSTAGGAAADSERVQALRGFACILLVAFHVIGAHSDSGMVVADDSWWRTFSNIFTPLRMPLFTFLSGFVYGYGPSGRIRSGCLSAGSSPGCGCRW